MRSTAYPTRRKGDSTGSFTGVWRNLPKTQVEPWEVSTLCRYRYSTHRALNATGTHDTQCNAQRTNVCSRLALGRPPRRQRGSRHPALQPAAPPHPLTVSHILLVVFRRRPSRDARARPRAMNSTRVAATAWDGAAVHRAGSSGHPCAAGTRQLVTEPSSGTFEQRDERPTDREPEPLMVWQKRLLLLSASRRCGRPDGRRTSACGWERRGRRTRWMCERAPPTPLACSPTGLVGADPPVVPHVIPRVAPVTALASAWKSAVLEQEISRKRPCPGSHTSRS